MRRPRAPEGLDKAGAALWKDVTGVYELSPAEVETLRQCCRQVDLIARLDEMLARTPVMVKGSTGQPKVNPLVSAVAEARRTLDGLQRSLNLPMPGEVTGRRRSPSAQAAAQARWRAQRGTVA